MSRYAGQVTAVVSVADDGGSSGRLRAFWPGPAPGDVRRCLLSLAGDGPLEKLWAQVLDYRFAAGELAGHSLGNLVLVALSEVTGNFALATAELGRLLGVSARVLPATLETVDLCAETETPEGTAEVTGQAKVTHSPAPVRRVWLSPSSPEAPEEVVAAIASADQVVLGPGSLFTSVLAVCAVPAVRDALGARTGGRVYVCNLAPQEGETTGFDADAHLEALAAHGVLVDAVVCDPSTSVGAPSWRGSAVPGERSVSAARVVTGALARPDGHSHNPAFLAEVLESLVLSR
ncbi:MAG: YvcK family protein [Actinobacteria bacterium]|nr:YvcK family protein [Actinomycetota bacterium]